MFFYNRENLPSDADTLKTICIEMMAENERLEAMLRLNRHRQFGPSSESLSQMKPLFDAETREDSPPEDNRREVEVRAHKKKVGRKPIPDHLPRVDIPLDIDSKQCQGCGSEDELKKVSESVSEKVHIEPAKAVVHRYIRPVYSCKHCECMKAAPMPIHPIPKCSVTPETIAHICINKYMDGLPLYRQEKIFLRQGVEIKRENMARWMVQISRILSPLKNRLHERLLSSELLMMDETTVQVLKEKGRTPVSKSYMLVQARGDPDGKSIVLFHYNPSRAKAVVKELVAGFEGVFMTDGLGVYDSLCLDDGSLQHVGCWQHVRRKFTDAYKGLKASQRKNSLSGEAITMIDKIFRYERQAKELGLHERKAIRQELSKPVIDEMKVWLDRYQGSLPKKSMTGQAINYLSHQWEKLTLFLDDGRIPLHNNFTENMIRPFCVGRRNWLFSDTPEGAHASATLYSLLVTAKVNGLNPYEYMCRLLKELPSAPKSDLDQFLPFASIH